MGVQKTYSGLRELQPRLYEREKPPPSVLRYPRKVAGAEQWRRRLLWVAQVLWAVTLVWAIGWAIALRQEDLADGADGLVILAPLLGLVVTLVVILARQAITLTLTIKKRKGKRQSG